MCFICLLLCAGIWFVVLVKNGGGGGGLFLLSVISLASVLYMHMFSMCKVLKIERHLAICYYSHRCPQWSDDEQLCCRSVTNEVHCYENGRPGLCVVAIQ